MKQMQWKASESKVSDHLFSGKMRPLTVQGVSPPEYLTFLKAILFFTIAALLIGVLI